MSPWGNILPRGPGGRQGQEHTDARAPAACRDVQEPSFPRETPVKPQSRGSVKSLGTCRTEWVAVRTVGRAHRRAPSHTHTGIAGKVHVCEGQSPQAFRTTAPSCQQPGLSKRQPEARTAWRPGHHPGQTA